MAGRTKYELVRPYALGGRRHPNSGWSADPSAVLRNAAGSLRRAMSLDLLPCAASLVTFRWGLATPVRLMRRRGISTLRAGAAQGFRPNSWAFFTRPCIACHKGFHSSHWPQESRGAEISGRARMMMPGLRTPSSVILGGGRDPVWNRSPGNSRE